jgi:hypothetical protein
MLYEVKKVGSGFKVGYYSKFGVIYLNKVFDSKEKAVKHIKRIA